MHDIVQFQTAEITTIISLFTEKENMVVCQEDYLSPCIRLKMLS